MSSLFKLCGDSFILQFQRNPVSISKIFTELNISVYLTYSTYSLLVLCKRYTKITKIEFQKFPTKTFDNLLDMFYCLKIYLKIIEGLSSSLLQYTFFDNGLKTDINKLEKLFNLKYFFFFSWQTFILILWGNKKEEDKKHSSTETSIVFYLNYRWRGGTTGCGSQAKSGQPRVHCGRHREELSPQNKRRHWSFCTVKPSLIYLYCMSLAQK